MGYEIKGAEEDPPEGHRSRTGKCEDPVRPRERWEILQGSLLLLTQLPFCIMLAGKMPKGNLQNVVCNLSIYLSLNSRHFL